MANAGRQLVIELLLSSGPRPVRRVDRSYDKFSLSLIHRFSPWAETMQVCAAMSIVIFTANFSQLARQQDIFLFSELRKREASAILIDVAATRW
jgi:hypothetical protein